MPQVRRQRDRARPDRATTEAIIDEAMPCGVGSTDDDPHALPTFSGSATR